MKQIEEAPSDLRIKILQGPFIEAFLNRKGIEVPCLPVLFLDVFLQILTVNVFSSRVVSFSILGISFAWLGLREILQIFSSSSNLLAYFNDPSNFLDLAQLSLTLAVFLTRGDEEVLILVCILVSWFRLMFIFGNLIFSVAVFLSALISVSHAHL